MDPDPDPINPDPYHWFLRRSLNSETFQYLFEKKENCFILFYLRRRAPEQGAVHPAGPRQQTRRRVDPPAAGVGAGATKGTTLIDQSINQSINRSHNTCSRLFSQ